MLKFVIATEEDLREAAAIEGRRRYEEERKKRIFNAKQRLFGLDYDTIRGQIREKEQMKINDGEKERLYCAETKKRAYMLRAMELEQEKQMKHKNMDLEYFRCQYQRKNLRREFDLNDPDAIKKEQPTRIGDDDPRLGISSAQIFLGEDISGPQRRQAQKTQQRAWLQQQMRERKQAEEDRKTADAMFHKSMKSTNQQLMELSAIDRENRLKTKASIRYYNEILAKEKESKKQLLKKQTQEDNLAEIYNMLGSDLLSDRPDKAKITRKGMTPEDATAFRNALKKQTEEKRRRQDDYKMKEAMWDQFTLNTTRELILKDNEWEQIRRAQNHKQFEDNQSLAQEQKERRNYMNKVVYKNHASQEYWDQFNRTTR